MRLPISDTSCLAPFPRYSLDRSKIAIFPIAFTLPHPDGGGGLTDLLKILPGGLTWLRYQMA